MGTPTPLGVEIKPAVSGIKVGGGFMATFSELWSEVEMGTRRDVPKVKSNPDLKSTATAAYRVYIKSSGPMLDRLAHPEVSDMLARLAERQHDYSTAALLRAIPDFVACRYSVFQLSDAQHDIAAEFFDTPTPYGLVLDDPTLAIDTETRFHLQHMVKSENWGFAFVELVDALADPANARSVVMRLVGRLLAITMA